MNHDTIFVAVMATGLAFLLVQLFRDRKDSWLPSYPRITRADLARLTLDSASARQFERRFFPGTIGGAALVFGGVGASIAFHQLGLLGDKAAGWGMLVSFFLGTALALTTHRRMIQTKPRSVSTGHEMQPFVLAHGEIAYIDEASRTYFLRVYIE